MMKKIGKKQLKCQNTYETKFNSNRIRTCRFKADYNKKSYIKSHSKAYNLHPNYDLICAVEKRKKIENYLLKNLINLHIKI